MGIGDWGLGVWGVGARTQNKNQKTKTTNPKPN